MNSNTIPQTLNDQETARVLKKAVQTLRNDRHLGQGCPYVKLGKRSVRYLVKDIESYLMKNRIEPEKD